MIGFSRGRSTWRVGGLSKSVVNRVISILKGILIGAMILISLKNSYVLSPPTLQAITKAVPVYGPHDILAERAP